MREPAIGDIVKVYYKHEESFGFISSLGPIGEGTLYITLFNHPTPLRYGIIERNLFWFIVVSKEE